METNQIACVDLFIAPGIWLRQHFAVERGNAMFVPFYSKVFLAFESGNVIGLRMMKMMSGGSGSRDEAHLMVTEKVDAMFESWCKPDGWRHGEQRRRTVPGTRRRKRETTITLDLTDVVGNGSGRAGDSHRGGSRKIIARRASLLSLELKSWSIKSSSIRLFRVRSPSRFASIRRVHFDAIDPVNNRPPKTCERTNSG
jgi:hypothetical protein